MTSYTNARPEAGLLVVNLDLGTARPFGVAELTISWWRYLPVAIGLPFSVAETHASGTF